MLSPRVCEECDGYGCKECGNYGYLVDDSIKGQTYKVRENNGSPGLGELQKPKSGLALFWTKYFQEPHDLVWAAKILEARLKN